MNLVRKLVFVVGALMFVVGWGTVLGTSWYFYEMTSRELWIKKTGMMLGATASFIVGGGLCIWAMGEEKGR